MNPLIHLEPHVVRRSHANSRFHWRVVVRCLLASAMIVGLAALPIVSQAAPTATTWYVDDTGSNSPSCGTALLPCRQIKTVIDKSSPGDTILIAAGLYQENPIIPLNLTLIGAGVGVTVIDGNSLGSVIAIGLNGENIAVNLSGVTLQHGGNTSSGGGLYIEAGQVVVADSAITNNAASNGAGIYNQGRLTLTNVDLDNNGNTANTQRGGGLLNLGQASLFRARFTDNRAASGGGIANQGTFTMTSVVLTNNQAGQGGGLYNSSQVIDSGTVITNNQAETSGGGIYNTSSGALTLVGTSIVNNTATSAFGGGLYNEGGADLSNLNLKDNRALGGNGGGIYNSGASSSLTFSGGIVQNNQAANNGGGIYHGGGQLNLTQSSLLNNRATTGNGGGLFNNTTATLFGTLSQDNQAASGGGLYNNDIGRLSVTQGTIYKNTSTQSVGGGINNRGVLTLTQSAVYSNTSTAQGASGLHNSLGSYAALTNVTFSDNNATNGGAIVNDDGTLRINNGTISHNKAPGLLINGGSAILSNTIVALNTAGANCSGSIVSGGSNLDSGNTCGFAAVGDITNTDPLLGKLQNSGGGTFTRALALSSRAVDGGNNTTCASVDQRGIARPQGNSCDIGAYEILGFTNSVPVPIQPNTCVTSTTFISSSFAIGSLHLGVNANFAPRSDLRISLRAPFGTVVNALGATGGTGQNLDVLWDDDSTNGPVGTADHDTSGSFYKYVHIPDSPLSTLFGKSVRGAWQLIVCNVSNNTGTLNRWTIVIPDIDKFKTYLPVVRRNK